MDPTSLNSPQTAEIQPVGWSLEEILRLSLTVFLKKFLVLAVPAFLAFTVMSAVDVALAAVLGKTSMPDETGLWVRWIISSILGMACFGVAIGAIGHAVCCDLSGQAAGLKATLQAAWQKAVPLTIATFLYHIVVLVPAVPGFAMLWWSMQLSMDQRLLPALACVPVAGVLLYWPFRLFLQMIFFAFPVVEEGKDGWSALLRSRELIRKPGAGGITGNSMFRIFVVLHVSLMPALVVLFMVCIPVVMMIVVYSWDQFMEDIYGHRITLPFIMFQALNVVMMTLIMPIFVVPLAVVYQDIKNRLVKA